MATEYGKRLKKAMAHAKLNQKGLIAATGLKQSTVSSAMNRSVGSSDTPAYAAACGVSALWLATGDGEMLPIYADMSATIGGIGNITATGTLTDGSKHATALVEPDKPVTETIANYSVFARAIAQLYDSLPDDAQVRAVVFAEVCDAIMRTKRQLTPAPLPAHPDTPLPKKLSV